MSTVIILQILYALVGAAYNAVSIARVRRGRAPLSATNPVKGLVIMAVVAGVTLTQPYVQGAIYIIGWLVLIWYLGRGAVAAHFKAISSRQNLHLYASLPAAYLAFLINGFGVVVGGIGVLSMLGTLLHH
ncbi:MAG: hypothetical protein O2967_01590 [Proteobacteria bacterium]|nr:hypothetical protein [Pseudomonadota bacterium]